MSVLDVSGSVALVTGAAGGIGLAIAKGFAQHGADVVMLDRAATIEETAASVQAEGRVRPVCADLTSADEVSRAIDGAEQEFGGIDVLVNAHGVNVRKPIEEYALEEWDRILNVNTKATFEVTRRVAERMKPRGFGRVVSLSSMQSSICWNGGGRFSLAPYCASKAAVDALTRAFALELAQHGITVNSICPGFVDTPLVEPVKNDPELYGDIAARTPIGRFARTEEIVAPILFLSSKASSYITGQSILVDGGWTIQ